MKVFYLMPLHETALQIMVAVDRNNFQLSNPAKKKAALMRQPLFVCTRRCLLLFNSLRAFVTLSCSCCQLSAAHTLWFGKN